ncbi:glutaredoxin family protein [Mariniluteicoccus endophyticus]
MTGPRVRILTRVGCHLCAEAVAVAERVCREKGCTLEQVDVDSDPALRAEHTDHVPVTFVDGAKHAIWFLDEDKLRAAL